MAKYHFNPQTGETGVCGAQIRCRFKLSEEQHFNSAEAASLAYEQTQNEDLLTTQSKPIKKGFSTMAYINNNAPDIKKESLEEANVLIQHFSLDEYEDEIEIPNSNKEASSAAWITLADVKNNPRLAAGNCGSVSYALESELSHDFSSENIDFSSVEVKYQDGYNHVANKAILPNGDIVMVDYTANQYDQTLPTPYVAGVKEWAATINDRVKKLHNTEMSEESLKNLF